MPPKTRQQSWIHGLPSLVKEGGVPFKSIPFSMPRSDESFLNLTLSTQRYVEFKLWDTTVMQLKEERHIAFNSNGILSLTGSNT